MTNSNAIVVQSAAACRIADTELEDLLQRVYVQGGFTNPEAAKSLFAAEAVWARGEILVVRGSSGSEELRGMVIVVAPTSPARRIAGSDESEMHLLAVSPSWRGRGIGGALIEGALNLARRQGYARMVLWTQPTMQGAQRLYEAAGFTRQADRDFVGAGRRFFCV